MKKPYFTLVVMSAFFATMFGQIPLAHANPNVRDGIYNFTDWTVHSSYAVTVSIDPRSCAQNGPVLDCWTTLTFMPSSTINFGDGRNWAFSFELPSYSTSTYCFAAPFGDGFCGAQRSANGQGVYLVGSSTEIFSWTGGLGFGDGTELGLQVGCFDSGGSLPCVLIAGQEYSLNISLLWAHNADQPPLVTDGEAMTMTIWDRGTASALAREPIVIVPGIMGSELKRSSDGAEVWPNATKMLFSPSDDYLDDLKLAADGKRTTEIKAGDIVREELVTLSFYKDLIQSLKADGYEEGVTLFVAPYDWRFGVASSVTAIAPVLTQAAAHSNDGKINVIAHSMGGLLMKEYLRSATTSYINKLVLAGVPQLGAPSAFKLLNYGDDLGLAFFGIGLNQGKAKEISANMPGVYDLLPSRRYLGIAGGYVKDFRNGAVNVLDYDHAGALTPNVPLVAAANAFHAALDEHQFNANASSIYNIIGCKRNTLGEIIVYDGGKYGVVPINGDGTVPLTSAFNLSSGYHTFFAVGDDHVGLVQHNAPLTLIKNIVDDVMGEPPSGISSLLSDCIAQTSSPEDILVSTHGPAELHVYDDAGHHTGPNEASGTIELGIPKSSYHLIEKDRFVILPKGTGYHVAVQATASGTLDLGVTVLDAFAPKKKTTYLAVPLKHKKTRAKLDLDMVTSSQVLQVDTNGDGISDVSYEPTAILVSSTSVDIEPPMPSLPVFPPGILPCATTTIVFGAKDDGSGIAFVKATLNGVAVNSGEVVTIKCAGDNIFRIEAEDNAGNPSMKEITFVASVPHSLVLSPSADTYIRQGKANKNQGTERILRIRRGGANRALVKFDEQELRRALGTSTINFASLQFTIARNNNYWGDGRALQAFRLLRNWGERGVTWNCANDEQPLNYSPNCPNDAWKMTSGSLPFAVMPTASTTILRKMSGSVNFDVTEDVKQIVGGGAINNGWIIKKEDEQAPGQIEFFSREASSGPVLVVQYAP